VIDVISQQPEVISYRALRRAIGFLGILLPLLVTVIARVFGNTGCQPSISAYFHTTAREVFVGVLAVVGAFLISYKGFDSTDSRASNLAGVAAICVAAFPCQSRLAGPKLGIFQLPQNWSNHVHVLAAAVLFVTLAGISAFLFTKTDAPPNAMTDQKKSRNVVYRTCAVVMALALLEIAAASLLLTEAKQDLYRTTLLGEAVALLAFGVSWLIKGEMILGDK
jgi:drug/metabolite transporter (DMT)-like permease